MKPSFKTKIFLFLYFFILLLETNNDVEAAKLKSIVAKKIALGAYTTLVVNATGDVYRFGLGAKSPLEKLYFNHSQNASQLAHENDEIVQIVAGGYHFLALTENNKLYQWGRMGTESETIDQPQLLNSKFPELNNIKIRKVSAGFDHTLIVTEDNKVYALGKGDSGQLGMGAKITLVTKPTLISSLVTQHIDIKDACCGGHHSLILSVDGNVYSFGWNQYGELGLGIPAKKKFTPTLIPYFRDNKIEVKQISCGGDHSLVLSKNGDVYSFGWGEYGQLGHNSTDNLDVPRKIALNDNIVQVAAGGYAHSLLLNEKGEVYAFGWNSDGQLGLKSRDNELLPRKIPGMNNIKFISAGYVNSALVNERGEVFLFGSNVYGQLGMDHDDVDDDDESALPDMWSTLNWGHLFENEVQENETNVIIVDGVLDSTVIGITQNINQRLTQEDVALYVEDVETNQENNERKMSLFAVFDGHGGSVVSKYLGTHFGEVLRAEFQKDKNVNNFTSLLEKTYSQLDTQLRKDVSNAQLVGSTALTCLFVRINRTLDDPDLCQEERKYILSSRNMFLSNNTHFVDKYLYCANVGDSEAVLVRGRTPIVLSTLHRPQLKSESQRIIAAGGFISRNRVNNILAVTRSFGDWIFGNLITSMPSHHSIELKPEDTFLILASDGLWDVITYQEATNLVLQLMESNNKEILTAQKVSDYLVNSAIRKNTFDNITVIVVKLK